MNPAAYGIIVLIILIIVEILIFNSIYLTPETRKEEGWRLWLAIGATLLLTVFGGATLYVGVYGNKKTSDMEYGWFNRKKKNQKEKDDAMSRQRDA